VYCPTCQHRLTGYGYTCGCGHLWTKARFGQFGFDLIDGDPTIGLGGGLVEDLRTGEIELEVAPGIDVPLGDSGW
jgi:hypothetical protein